MDVISDTANTLAIWVIVILTLVVWICDCIIALRYPGKHTMSEVMLAIACRYPIIPFAIGILVGHLLWPQRLTQEQYVNQRTSQQSSPHLANRARNQE